MSKIPQKTVSGVEHIPTDATRKFVVECTRARIKQADIAEQLGITDVTLRKHYSEYIALGRTQIAHRASEIIYNFLEKPSEALTPDELKHQRDTALKVLNSHGWASQVEHTGEVALPQIVAKRAPDHPEDK